MILSALMVATLFAGCGSSTSSKEGEIRFPWILEIIMNEIRQKLTLDRPSTYQIKVPGDLDQTKFDWYGVVTSIVEKVDSGMSIVSVLLVQQTSLKRRLGIQNDVIYKYSFH